VRRLFSTFPSQWPGIGLLLLRALVGYSLMAQGMAYVRTPGPGVVTWGLAALTFVGAAFLLVGLMTPLVALLVAVGGAGIALYEGYEGYVAITNLIGPSIAIALLGPGAFSLDARMFGRREITIPSSSNAEGASPSPYWKM
jgi:uncharacterized membrane protein YphA (DoxX/SURF4 family)